MGTPPGNYSSLFELDASPPSQKSRDALNLALDIRKFEIGLYWRRTAYFWALIAVAFAGYFGILSAEHLDDKTYFAFIVSCIGLIFTWAWLLANRGSKFWQENWENHVDLLEDDLVGPLYKTVLRGPEKMNLIGPKALSVSRINQWVSVFTAVIWLALLLHTIRQANGTWCVDTRRLTIGAITLAFAVVMYVGSKTNFRDKQLAITKRKTTLTNRTD